MHVTHTRGPGGEEEWLRVGCPPPVVVAGDDHLVLAARLQRVEHVAPRLQRRRRRAEDLARNDERDEPWVAWNFQDKAHLSHAGDDVVPATPRVVVRLILGLKVETVLVAG